MNWRTNLQTSAAITSFATSDSLACTCNAPEVRSPHNNEARHFQKTYSQVDAALPSGAECQSTQYSFVGKHCYVFDIPVAYTLVGTFMHPPIDNYILDAMCLDAG